MGQKKNFFSGKLFFKNFLKKLKRGRKKFFKTGQKKIFLKKLKRGRKKIFLKKLKRDRKKNFF